MGLARWHRSPGRRWVGVLVVLAVLVTGMAATAGVFVTVDRGEQRYAGQVMDRYADEVATARVRHCVPPAPVAPSP